MNGGQGGKPRITKLNVTDVIAHHIHLQDINKKRWRFITCPGGMVSDLCKNCRYSDLCKKHEREEEKMIKIYVNTFSEDT